MEINSRHNIINKKMLLKIEWMYKEEEDLEPREATNDQSKEYKGDNLSMDEDKQNIQCKDQLEKKLF